MKIGSLAAARPMYWDRNPVEQNAVYENTLAPHTLTTRFTYTVASGKKAFVDTAYAAVIRAGVATAPGDVLSVMKETPNGGSQAALVRANLYVNTSGEKTYANTGGSILMLAGAVLVGQTQDTSTGGTIAFNIGMHAIEYDA